MNLIKKILFILLIIFIVLPYHVVLGEEGYEVYDALNPNEKETFDDFSSANRYYSSVIGEYQNAILKENNNVLKMEYGIVEFKRNEGCSLISDYYSIYRNNTSSLNACYGVDGAYVSSSNDASIVYFIIAGDYGYIDYDNVILHPLEELDVKTSVYEAIDGKLYHQIKTQLDSDYYSYSIPLYSNNLNLNDGEYYSYDGHYFYNDFYLMIDDYETNDFSNAINKDNPYYNYYQYLPYRSLSNYEYTDIENYFYHTLGIDKKLNSYNDFSRDNANDIVNRSQYYGELKSFFEYQYIYGANALMMLSQSINESAYGKSLNAYLRNNLFTNSAYESDEERNASRYNYLESSIYSQAKYYISQSYSNFRKTNYYGTFFGNKVSGINPSYTLDHYWGEKAAANYYRLDLDLGLKDKDIYCLGIINRRDLLTIYRTADLRSRYYTLENLRDFSVIILEELEDSYLIQLDPSFDSEYLYDFERSVGYIKKSDIDYLINEDKINNYEFVNITFDLDGGNIYNLDTINMKVKKGSLPIINNVKKDGYEFIGFDSDIDYALEDKTYKAIYKKIDHIEISKMFNKDIIYGQPLDLSKGRLKAYYDDNTNKEIEIETQMISSFDSSIDGNQNIYINYCGLEEEVEINNSKGLLLIKDNVSNYISSNIESYENNKTYKKDELKYIRDNFSLIKYNPTFKEIRLLDEMLLEDFDKKVFIDDEKYNLSISGLALSVKDNNSSLFNFLNNTYYLKVNDIQKDKYDRLSKVASGYGFEIIDGLNISLSLNYQNSEINGPVIIQLNIPELNNNKVYSIYHLNAEGDVVKCRTTQTNNFIQFITDELGDFIILSLDSANNYEFDDYVENISRDNDYYDNHGLFRSFLLFSLLSIIGFIMIVIYYLIENKKEKAWKDYKKSLLIEDTVQEEKQKN